MLLSLMEDSSREPFVTVVGMPSIFSKTTIGIEIRIDNLFLTTSRDIRDIPNNDSSQAIEDAMAVPKEVVEQEVIEASSKRVAEEHSSL